MNDDDDDDVSSSWSQNFYLHPKVLNGYQILSVTTAQGSWPHLPVQWL